MWRVALGSVLLGLTVAAGCSDDGDPEAASTTSSTERSTTTTTSTTVPERPSSTTTTALDPATVEGQVEAAYLRSWDVYADAVYNLELDEEAFAAIYAEPYLSTVRNELQDRIVEGRAAYVIVDHDYTIQVLDPSTAVVADRYRNHQVLIDPETKEPIEPDPDEPVLDVVTVRLIEGTWRISLIEEATS